MFPGAFTASLACTALQLVVNEFDVRRVRYVSSRSSRPATSTSVPSTSQTRHSTDDPTNSESLFVAGSGADGLQATGTDVSASEPESGPSFGERMLAFIGITRVDDEEYLRRLKARRERYLTRIRELEEVKARQEVERKDEAQCEFVSDESEGSGRKS